ncbi:hypothetical protein [Chryseobacterium flavum]|uniref:hypothetical protein n=1 Tax=Chryseobacterium flavum TaxID=415851 RepID=UPI0028A85C03|nr:hypothetical protein [Chryseobacterium flavum]
MNIFSEILLNGKAGIKNAEFTDVLMNLKSRDIRPENVPDLIRIYKETKRLDFRNKILRLLYDHPYPELKSFFEMAYKKERYLDMKMYALRGLAQFSDEKEIEKLINKLKVTLAKREQSTPYNYQEYELLRGKNALPFLIERYRYVSFIELFTQVNEQYDRMPDAFKGHFTTDEYGEIISLRAVGESSKLINAFFNKPDAKK